MIGDVFGCGEDGAEELAGEETVEAGCFGQRDELVWRDETALRMLPASEGFEAPEQSGTKLDERLKVRDDLVAFEGSTQVVCVFCSHGRDDTTAVKQLPSKFSSFPAGDEVPRGFRPVGKRELEAGSEEAAGDDLTALQDEFGFGAHEEGADLDHPRCSGQADAGAPGFADRAEEVAIGEWMWGGEVDDAGEVFGGDEEFDGADEVGFVDPGDKLIAVAIGAAEAVADEREEDVEDSAGVWAEGHGAAQGDLAGARSGGGEEGLFPGFGDLDGEVPGIGCAGFVAAEFAGGFVHGAVEGVAIDGGGAGVEPNGGWVIERGDDLVEESCGLDTGIEDGAAIGWSDSGS